MKASNPHESSRSSTDDNSFVRSQKISGAWTFQSISTLRCMSPCLKASDVIGSIDYSEDGSFFATGGVARKIRIYSYEDVLHTHSVILNDEAAICEEEEEEDEEDEERDDGSHIDQFSRCSSAKRSLSLKEEALDHDRQSRTIICTPAKLSSVRWKPGYSWIVGCGDYDGTVAEWDLEQGCAVREMHEHGGHRVYSLDYSLSSPFPAVSASGDGTVKMWSHNSDESVGIATSPDAKSFCCAEFNKKNHYLMAAACANSNVYIYDLRNLSSPLFYLNGHTRAVSYVRWLRADQLVSASTDSSIKLWDISLASRVNLKSFTDECVLPGHSHISLQDRIPEREFISHVNRKHFVGLSAMEDGLIVCGSETNEVFIYQQHNSTPILQLPMSPPVSIQQVSHHPSMTATPESTIARNSFVSSVSWRDQGDHYSLIAANSDGVVHVMKALSDNTS